MTQVVYKFPIAFEYDVRVMMPEEALVTAVNVDANNIPCVWALVDPDKPRIVERKFSVHPTGGRVPDFWEHRGTFFDMPFVWHVFEEKLT